MIDSTPNSICIVRLSALGDVLMLVPLIRTLQSNFPKTKLTWVISQPAYDLVSGIEGVEFILINKPKHLMDYWRFKKLMKDRKFDVLLATQASFRANLLYPLIPAKRKIGYDSVRAKDGHHWFVHESIVSGQDHTLDGFIRFAEKLGIHHKEIRWDLPISSACEAWARSHLPIGEGPIVVINPAASKPERSWPADRYIETIRYLQSRWNANIVLTGGPGDQDRKLGNAIVASTSVTNLIGQTKPNQLMALIAKADLMLCPDTGPSHMAAAVSTPTVAMHAVTSADVSGPYIYRDMAVDCYPEAVEKILKKTMLTNVWGTQVHDDEAMLLVSVDKVIHQLDAVLAALKRKSPHH